MWVHLTKTAAYLTLKFLFYENRIKKDNNKKPSSIACFHPSVLFFIPVVLQNWKM